MRTNRIAISLLCLLAVLIASRPTAARAGQQSATVSAMVDMNALHPGDKTTIAVVVDFHPGLHAQSTTPVEPDAIPFALELDKNSDATFGDIQFPKGEIVTYTALGKLNVYRGLTVVRIPVTVNATTKPGPLTITGKVSYQACDDTACFQPEKQTFTVTTKVVPSDQPGEPNPNFITATKPLTTTQPSTQAVITPSVPTGTSPQSFHRVAHPPKETFDHYLKNSSVPFAFGVAFLIGIIFNAMPCVLPVLPLKIMGFYEVSQHSRSKSVLLGTVFSIGIIASFAVLAFLIVVFQQLKWGDLFKHAWFNATISLVLVAMAISTFGFFTVNVPNALYAYTPRHDTYVGNFLFGVLTAALSTPCTFGMFVGLLTWAIAQPSWLGVSVIMMVGVGMAAPYLVLSAVPEVARNFPRTGPWAEVVKQMMGFLLLATALYFAQPFFQSVLSVDAFWWSLFAIIAAGGVFLIVRALQLSRTAIPRAIAIGIAIAIIAPSAYLVHRLTEKPYIWQPYSDRALAAAIAAGKPVVIDFTAAWCGNCHYLEGFVLHSSDVVRAVHDQDVVMLQADVTNSNAAGGPLLSKLNPIGSIPLTAVYLPRQDQPTLLNGLYSAEDLVDALQP